MARVPRRLGAAVVVWVVLGAAVSSAACGGSGAADEPGFNLFSPEEDVTIGRESAAKILADAPLLDKPEIEAYLGEIGERLARHAPGAKYPYEFHVLDVRELNAFALPGGIVFVNRGTLETVRDEGELAGVLAHEIGHVALRHGTSQMSKAYIAKRGFDIFRRITGGGARPGDASQMADSVGGLGLNTLFLKFSRDAESQADLVGARMLAEAGYDPLEMARFFDQVPRGQNGPAFLSDHPALGDRASAVADIRSTLVVSSSPITLTDGFWRMKSALTLLPPAQSMQLHRVGPGS